MDLITIEEIRQLKYRYLRCLDLKLWDEFAQVFTEDATANYGTKTLGEPLELNGRAAIVEFMSSKLGPDILTSHAGGQPEITVDGDRATGIWRFLDTVIAHEYKVIIQGAAFYNDRYRREDGRWLIEHIGYERTYEYMYSFDGLPNFQLTANLWADQPA